MSSKTQVDPYGLSSFFSPWPRPHRPRPTTRAHSHWLGPAHTGPSHMPHSQRPRPHGHPTASPAGATRPLAPSISALCVPLSANLFPRASTWHVPASSPPLGLSSLESPSPWGTNSSAGKHPLHLFHPADVLSPGTVDGMCLPPFSYLVAFIRIDFKWEIRTSLPPQGWLPLKCGPWTSVSLTWRLVRSTECQAHSTPTQSEWAGSGQFISAQLGHGAQMFAQTLF